MGDRSVFRGASDSYSDKTLTSGMRELGTASPTEFPKQWLLRMLWAELFRYCTHDEGYVDTEGEPFKCVAELLSELGNTEDWVSEKLQTVLARCREIATVRRLPTSQTVRSLGLNGHSFEVFESAVAVTAPPMRIGSTNARSIPFIENSLGNPERCGYVVNAFATKIDKLKTELGVSHLGFIAKEMGPVGTVPMMSALVVASGLPACIYRENYWVERTSLAGWRPSSASRVLMVYDVMVTGAGIGSAADVIKNVTGADVVAALILNARGKPREELISNEGQRIAVDTFVWNEDSQVDALLEDLSGRGEAPTTSEPREQPREEAEMAGQEGVPNQTPIPPGDYTARTLPTLSQEADAILGRVRARSKAFERRRKSTLIERAAEVTRLADVPVSAVRLTDRPQAAQTYFPGRPKPTPSGTKKET